MLSKEVQSTLNSALSRLVDAVNYCGEMSQGIYSKTNEIHNISEPEAKGEQATRPEAYTFSEKLNYQIDLLATINSQLRKSRDGLNNII